MEAEINSHSGGIGAEFEIAGPASSPASKERHDRTVRIGSSVVGPPHTAESETLREDAPPKSPETAFSGQHSRVGRSVVKITMLLSSCCSALHREEAAPKPQLV